MNSSISPFLLQLLSSQGQQPMQSNAPQIPLATRPTGGMMQAPQQQRPIMGQQGNPLGAVTNLAQNGQKLYNMGFGGQQTPMGGMPANGVAPTQNASGIVGQGTAMPSQMMGQPMSPSMAANPGPASYMNGGNSGVFGAQGFMSPGTAAPGSLSGGTGQFGSMGANGLGDGSTGMFGGSATGASGAGDAAGSASATGEGSSWLSQLWDFL